MSAWFVYILRCADGSLYTGIATDPERRLQEHNHHPDAPRLRRLPHRRRLIR